MTTVTDHNPLARLNQQQSTTHLHVSINVMIEPTPHLHPKQRQSYNMDHFYKQKLNPTMPRQPPNTGSSATSTQPPVRLKRMMPDFYAITKAAIEKCLSRDYQSLVSLRRQEKNKPAWQDCSEDHRSDRMQSVAREWLASRKAAGKHVGCEYEVFEDYIPQFLGRARNYLKEDLMSRQISIIGQQPADEAEDEDDEEPVPTHIMAKCEGSGERELDDIEPYTATPEAEDESKDEAEEDDEEAESETETEAESEDEDKDEDEDGDEGEDEAANPTRQTLHANSSTVENENNSDEEPERHIPQTAIIRGDPHPLPASPSLLTKSLTALKQFYRTPPSLASTEKAVLRGRLDVVRGDGVQWEWMSVAKKRAVNNDEGDGKERREGWRKRVKVEVKGGRVVKVERKGGLA